MTIDPRNPVLVEAQKRFDRCSRWEATCRQRYITDIKFSNADADNQWQWPNELRVNRDIDQKPCLTINKTRQHNLLIINDAKQHKPGIAVRAVGNGATYEAAQVWSSIIRRIEYQSGATAIYDRATVTQVQGGVGYWRIITDYVDDSSFDQEIYLEGVADPLKVYLDPDAKKPDKSDAKFGFIFDDVPKDEFDILYPKYKDIAGQNIFGVTNDWNTSDKVRVCEYYRIEEEEDTLWLVPQTDDPKAVPAGTYKSSELPGDIIKELRKRKDVKSREFTEKTVKYEFIVGDTIVPEESKDFPSKYIPIVQLKGEETVINGEMDRKGHTRALKDPQRMYNYWSSAAVEYGALQTKTPWIVAAEAIEGYETYWGALNRKNFAYIPYRSVGDDGEQIPPPQRVEPPTAAPVALQGMQVAAQEFMMASGQYEAQQGQQDNSRTGAAIQERQRQGDTATYHFIDELAISIRYTGIILLDMIPRIYDTKRVVMILGEDGVSSEVMIDPGQKQAFAQEQQANLATITRVLNPALGKYEVEADVGPAYGTKREAAFEAYKLILTQAPDLVQLIGDILFKAADFPMADEAAARLRRMVPPQALGQGPTQNEQALIQQLEQSKGLINTLSEQLLQLHQRLRGKEEDRSVDAFNALTKRLKVLADKHTDVHEFGLAVAGLMKDLHLESSEQNLDAVRVQTEQQMAQAKQQSGGSSA